MALALGNVWQLPRVELPDFSQLKNVLDVAHRHSVASFAMLFLLIGSSGIAVANQYLSARALTPLVADTTAGKITKPIAGFNMTVPIKETDQTLHNITHQPLTIMVGDQPSVVQADTIRGWLQVVGNKEQGVTYLHVDATKVSAALNKIAESFTKAPVNQVSVEHTDGTSGIITAGKNGTKVADPSGLASQISKNVLSAKGMQLSLPTESVAFAAVTPSAFDKMIEINVSSKQMYLWQNGQIQKQYPISAGAAATPTPIGQYKIFSKLAVQDMRGYNADGTKYFQPNVRWINYFLPGGYAIHGNYWRPTSWYGNINSSHGCASLPDYQAKEVYDWAPMGTTVITRT